MTATSDTKLATQTYTVYVKSTREAVWDALTNPDKTDLYAYRGRADYDLRPGGAYRAHASKDMLAMGSPEVVVEGEVIEVDAPNRLVQTWHPLFSPEMVDEPASRLTWEITDGDFGGLKLTLTHELDDSPLTAAMVAGAPGTGGGWAFVLSDLKSYLETGSSILG